MIPSLLRLIATFLWGGFYNYTTNKITNYKIVLIHILQKLVEI